MEPPPIQFIFFIDIGYPIFSNQWILLVFNKNKIIGNDEKIGFSNKMR